MILSFLNVRKKKFVNKTICFSINAQKLFKHYNILFGIKNFIIFSRLSCAVIYQRCFQYQGLIKKRQNLIHTVQLNCFAISFLPLTNSV